jgi:hypothetical protein
MDGMRAKVKRQDVQALTAMEMFVTMHFLWTHMANLTIFSPKANLNSDEVASQEKCIQTLPEFPQ